MGTSKIHGNGMKRCIHLGAKIWRAYKRASKYPLRCTFCKVVLTFKFIYQNKYIL